MLSTSDIQPKAFHVLFGIATILTAIGLALLNLFLLILAIANPTGILQLRGVILFSFVTIGFDIYGFSSGVRLVKRGGKQNLVACIVFSIPTWFLTAVLGCIIFIYVQGSDFWL